jgi:hypothetical protein
MATRRRGLGETSSEQGRARDSANEQVERARDRLTFAGHAAAAAVRSTSCSRKQVDHAFNVLHHAIHAAAYVNRLGAQAKAEASKIRKEARRYISGAERMIRRCAPPVSGSLRGACARGRSSRRT